MTAVLHPTTIITTTVPTVDPAVSVPLGFPIVRRGWHDDPAGRHDLRFHDGRAWTDHVTHFGPVPCQRGCRRHG